MSQEQKLAGGVLTAARLVPFPDSISLQARASLAAKVSPDGSAPIPPTFPPAHDLSTWRAAQIFAEKDMVTRFGWGERTAVAERRLVGGVPIYAITPAELPAERASKLYIEMHGGALFFGGGEACKMFGQMTAEQLGVRVHAVDYRMPPHDPYPAALDDCLAVYRRALDVYAPGDIAVGGGSAGGNLAAALVLRARDEGLPMPACVILLSPEIDLTESGDSFQVNRDADVTQMPLLHLNKIYAGNVDLADPYVSPLFGDFTKGFPPTLIQSGTRDLFLSNAARLHQKLYEAGIPAELHVHEARPHAGFGGAPEDERLRTTCRRFLDSQWWG